jgi:hypothetical protein
MATQIATTELTVVPGLELQADIASTFDAAGKLREAVDGLNKKRADDRSSLAQAVAKALAAAPLAENIVPLYNTFKTGDDARAAEINACEALQPIIREHAEQLIADRREAVAAYLEAKLTKLEAEIASQEVKSTVLELEIEATKRLIEELRSPHRAEAAKNN